MRESAKLEKSEQWARKNLWNGGGNHTHPERKSENAPPKGEQIFRIHHRQRRKREIQEAPGQKRLQNQIHPNRQSVEKDHRSCDARTASQPKTITEPAPLDQQAARKEITEPAPPEQQAARKKITEPAPPGQLTRRKRITEQVPRDQPMGINAISGIR